MNLFTYGTLTNDLIFKSVCGKIFPNLKTILKDYHKIYRPDGYSTIVYQKNSMVNSKVYFNVDQESIQRIDQFEGDLYKKQKVNLILRMDPLFRSIFIKLNNLS